MYYDDRYPRRPICPDDRYEYPERPRYPEYPGGRYEYPEYPYHDFERVKREMYHMFPAEYRRVHVTIIQVIDEMDDPMRYPIPPAEVVERMRVEIMRRVRYGTIGEESEGLDITSQSVSEDDATAQQFFFSPFFGPFLTTALLFNLLGRRTFGWW
mgnify:CR=1 FL=1